MRINHGENITTAIIQLNPEKSKHLETGLLVLNIYYIYGNICIYIWKHKYIYILIIAYIMNYKYRYFNINNNNYLYIYNELQISFINNSYNSYEYVSN